VLIETFRARCWRSCWGTHATILTYAAWMAIA
jgi:hypothetical protein